MTASQTQTLLSSHATLLASLLAVRHDIIFSLLAPPSCSSFSVTNGPSPLEAWQSFKDIRTQVGFSCYLCRAGWKSWSPIRPESRREHGAAVLQRWRELSCSCPRVKNNIPSADIQGNCAEVCLDGTRVSHPTRPVTICSHTQSVKESLTDGNLGVSKFHLEVRKEGSWLKRPLSVPLRQHLA